MASKALPSPEVLRQLLRYEPDTGKFFWLPRGPEWFDSRRSGYSPERRAKVFNTACAGREAASTRAGGYIRIVIFGKPYYAHRLAWVMVHGYWPENSSDIDHINMDASDNRIANLRIATRSQNQCNRRVHRNNKAGIKGVHFSTACSRWAAHIKIDGRSKNLGLFDSKEDAKAAYAKASRIVHGDFGRI